jgi:hypothetical protein
MRFSPLALVALLPLLPSAFAADPNEKFCTDAEGQLNGMGWWPELELPQSVASVPGSWFDVYLFKKLANHDTELKAQVSANNRASINIYNGHGDSQLYRVNFKDEDNKAFKSFLFWSNSGGCDTATASVPLDKVKHITVEMEKD